MKFSLLIFSFLLSLSLVAQEPKLSDNFDVQVGEMYDETDGSFKSFHKYKDYVVAINSQKKDLVVQIFDPETLEEKDRIIHKNFLKEDLKSGFEGLRRVGDNLILFYSKWNRKKQIESLEAQIFSLESLKFGKQIEIIQQQGKIAGSFGITSSRRWGTVNKYSYSTSFDESKLLIQYRLHPKFRDDSKNKDVIAINVFDSNLKELWKTQVQMPYTEKKMNNEDFTIDKDGDFYMLASVFEDDSTDEKKRKEKDANYHLELFKVKKNTKTLVKNEIRIGDKFIDEVLLYEDAKGDIVITGTSKNPDVRKGLNFGKTTGGTTGVFTVKLNEDGSLDSFKSYEFPLEMLNKNASRREKKKNKKKEKDEEEEPTFAGLKINNIVANNDGSFIILGEQQYVVIRTYTSMNGGTKTSTTYYYRDILATKIAADGSLVWMHKLPKFQAGSRGKGTMSYTHLFAGDSHFLVYLDNVKNLNLPDDEFPHKHSDRRGGYLTAYIIDDATGTIEKEAIFNTRDVKGIHLEHFDTDKILSLSSSEMLIEGFEGSSKDFLVKVSAKSNLPSAHIGK